MPQMVATKPSDWRLTQQRCIPYARHRRSALHAHAYCELLEALIGEGALVSGLTRSSRLDTCFYFFLGGLPRLSYETPRFQPFLSIVSGFC